MVSTPPRAITCINICVYLKDPVVHARVWWIIETLKYPACTIGWVRWLWCSWHSPGKAIKISHGRIPFGQYSYKKWGKKFWWLEKCFSWIMDWWWKTDDFVVQRLMLGNVSTGWTDFGQLRSTTRPTLHRSVLPPWLNGLLTLTFVTSSQDGTRNVNICSTTLVRNLRTCWCQMGFEE